MKVELFWDLSTLVTNYNLCWNSMISIAFPQTIVVNYLSSFLMVHEFWLCPEPEEEDKYV